MIKKSFTLIELIVVIAILGILAAIVIPNISSFQKKAKDTQVIADTRNIQTAFDMYMISDRKTGEKEIPVMLQDDDSVLTVQVKYIVEELSSNKITAPTGKTLIDGSILQELDTPEVYALIDFESLTPTYLRKTPSNVHNHNTEVIVAPTEAGVSADTVNDKGLTLHNRDFIIAVQYDPTFGTTTSIVSALTTIELDSGLYAYVAVN